MGGAEATRTRILDAAYAEFAAYGVAGARVDRIAQLAECNKNLIYVYFESKENLFATVLSRTLATVYGDLPFPTDDIPEFAGRLFDFVMANPQIIRLLAWSTLNENTRFPPGRMETHVNNVRQIGEAQSAGDVTAAYPPEFVLMAVLALVTAWSPALPFGLSVEPNPKVTQAEMRASVVLAITAMLGAGS